MYTITFKNKEYLVSGLIFWSLTIPVFGFFALLVSWFCWFVYLSTNMLEYYTNVHAVICGLIVLVLLGSITINGKEKALLFPLIRKILGLFLILITVYYQYTIQNWEINKLSLLIAPFIVICIKSIYKYYKKQTWMHI